jgi:hypothetical protein
MRRKGKKEMVIESEEDGNGNQRNAVINGVSRNKHLHNNKVYR